MCRIWGISYGPEGPEAEDWTPTELAQLMFPALIRRGPHAWGWMANVDGTIHSYKEPGRCDEQDAMDRMDLPEQPKWIVGHTRWATTGSPDDNRNNHPIAHGKIVGVHNGVLRNHEAILSITGREDSLTEVDSEAIFAAVNKWGHRAGLNRILGDMVAVYTHVDKPDTLHVAKSHGRPLLWGRTEAGSIIFASEERAIRNTGMVPGDLFALSEYRLYRLREGEVKSRVKYREELQDIPSYLKPKGSEKRSSHRRYSASQTRQAMRRAEAEVDHADRYIMSTRKSAHLARKLGVGLDDYLKVTRRIASMKGDPDWGTPSDRGSLVFIGNGFWVTYEEYVVEWKESFSRMRRRVR